MNHKEDEIRAMLMDSASYVIATEGYYKATTKRIARQAKLNEAYIYRYYESKEDLIRTAFALNDRNLAELIMDLVPKLEEDGRPWEDRCRALFICAWELMVSVDYDARFYVRYYYSEQYRIYAKAGHDKCYAPVAARLGQFFRPGVDASAVLKFVFEATIAMVFRTVSGDTDYTDEKLEQHFRLVYQAVRPYFRDGLAGDDRRG